MDYYIMLLDSFLSGQAFRTSACLHSDCKYKWLKPDNDKNVRLFSSFMVPLASGMNDCFVVHLWRTPAMTD